MTVRLDAITLASVAFEAAETIHLDAIAGVGRGGAAGNRTAGNRTAG